MAKTASLLMHDIRLSVIILFCGVTSGINIAKLAPTIGVLSKSFNLSLTQIGLLASIFTLIMVLGGLLIGGVARGVGTKRILLMALLISCFGNAVSLFGDSTLTLFIGRSIEGVSLISITLAAPAILTQHTAPAHRGWVMGMWGGFMPLGNAFAIICGPYFISTGGWQLVWEAGLWFSLIVCFLGWLFIPSDTGAMRRHFDVTAIKLALRLPLLAFIGLGFACHSLVYQTLIQFIPLFSRASIGLSLNDGAMITGLFCLLNFIGNLISGQALQRGQNPVHIIRSVFLLLSSLLILLIFFKSSSLILFLLLGFIGFVIGGSAPIFFYLVSRSSQDPQNLPVFVAWTFQIQGLGMLVGPALVGRVVDVTQSWSTGIVCLIPACFLIILFSGRLTLPVTKQNQELTKQTF